jgi:hypothetical protein
MQRDQQNRNGKGNILRNTYNDELPDGPRMRTQNTNSNLGIGYVVSIRESFGFIQPLISSNLSNLNNSSHDYNQIFFPLKECYRGVMIGDEVTYSSRNTPKGLQASEVDKINDSLKIIYHNIAGTIVKESDMPR